MNGFVLAFALLCVTDALRCYQGQQNASSPVQSSPMECLANSQSCLLTIDVATNTATRACQISNCTLNGAWSAKPVCTNSTGSTGSMYGSLTAYCCCYGDGCNEDQEAVLNPTPGETNLAGSIAHRIEDFYDRDAMPAERTFIRRVVNHVYQHIDRESKDND
ncbi:Protein F58B4.3 a [Aphelenchoides avenae]|nr:Protein F58B4.3 a [Aphelenchus avenae]